MDLIGDAMVSVVVSIAVDRECTHRSGQTKDFKIDICCSSDKHTALRERAKTGWFGIRIMCIRAKLVKDLMNIAFIPVLKPHTHKPFI